MNNPDVVAPIRYQCKDCDFSTGSLRSAAKHEQESGHATDVAADEAR